MLDWLGLALLEKAPAAPERRPAEAAMEQPGRLHLARAVVEEARVFERLEREEARLDHFEPSHARIEA